MIWEYCEVPLRRQSRQGTWRAEVQAHGTAGPMVGWVPVFAFYGADEWELVACMPSTFAADAHGFYLNEAVAVFKRPLSSNNLKHRLRASVAIAEGGAVYGG